MLPNRIHRPDPASVSAAESSQASQASQASRARSPQRQGQVVAAPENNAASAKKKRAATNKKINDSLAKQQKQIDEAAQKVGQLTNALRALRYDPQQNHEETLALNEELACAYNTLGYEHLLQKSNLERLLDIHAGAITPAKRHELQSRIVGSDLEFEHCHRCESVQNSLGKVLEAKKEEGGEQLQPLLQNLKQLRIRMDAMTTVRQMRERRALRASYDAVNLMQAGKQCAENYQRASEPLLWAKSRHIAIVCPQGLPEGIDVTDSGTLFESILQQSRPIRASELRHYDSSTHLVEKYIAMVLDDLQAGRSAYRAQDEKTPEAEKAYVAPLTRFMSLMGSAIEQTIALLDAQMALPHHLLLTEFSEQEEETARKPAVQNQLLHTLHVYIKFAAIQTEYYCNQALISNEVGQKHSLFDSGAIPNARGLLSAVENILFLQDLTAEHVRVGKDFPAGLSDDGRKQIYARLQIMSAAFEDAESALELLKMSQEEIYPDGEFNYSLHTLNSNLRQMQESLATSRNLLAVNIGKLVKAGLKPARAALDMDGDSQFQTLRAGLEQVAENWADTLPRIDLASEEPAPPVASNSEPGTENSASAELDLRVSELTLDGSSMQGGQTRVQAWTDSANEDAPTRSVGTNELIGQSTDAGQSARTVPDAPAREGEGVTQAAQADPSPGRSAQQDHPASPSSPSASNASAEALTALQAKAQRLFDKADDFETRELPGRLDALQVRGTDHRHYADSLLVQLQQKKDISKVNPDNIWQYYQQAINEMTAQHDLVRKALKLWRAVDADGIGMAQDVAQRIADLESRLTGYSEDIATAKKTALRKTANGHVLKPSDRGIEFLFRHDFIDMDAPPIEPYHVVASRMAFHREETDLAKRWRPMLAADGKTALLDRYQVFGFQIKPDESDPQAVRNNPDCYRCYLHALLDDRHAAADVDDGAYFDPDALQDYSQVKWKRGDEHKRGRMWEDRQRQDAGEAGEQHLGDMQVYRLFTGTRSLQEYVPRYLRMEAGQPTRLALVDLRQEAQRPARAT